jgi:hypothetical protein
MRMKYRVSTTGSPSAMPRRAAMRAVIVYSQPVRYVVHPMVAR